jgi:hypothetical protein
VDARFFMAVAERFGPKSARVAVLRIEPTVTYLLAVPSVAEDASEAAIRDAEKGERITARVAKEIFGTERKKPAERERVQRVAAPTQKLLGNCLSRLNPSNGDGHLGSFLC